MRWFLHAMMWTVCLALPGLAQAQNCPADGYGNAQLADATNTARDAMAQFDLPFSARTLNEAGALIPCYEEIVDPRVLADYARMRSLIAFYNQDEIGAIRWGFLAKNAYPALPWPDDMDEMHPYREMMEFSDEPPIGGPMDKGLAFPKGGAILMNGYLIEEPKAPAEVPVVLQLLDKKGVVFQTFWQDGAAFPEALLADPGGKYKVPKWYAPWDFSTDSAVASEPAVADVDPTPAPEPTVDPEPTPDPEPAVADPEPTPDPEPAVADADPEPAAVTNNNSTTTRTRKSKVKVANLAIGIGMGVAAGALYGIAYANNASFDDATYNGDKAAIRTATNLMVIGSGVLGAGAIGVGITGFISTEGSPGLGMNVVF